MSGWLCPASGLQNLQLAQSFRNFSPWASLKCLAVFLEPRQVFTGARQRRWTERGVQACAMVLSLGINAWQSSGF